MRLTPAGYPVSRAFVIACASFWQISRVRIMPPTNRACRRYWPSVLRVGWQPLTSAAHFS